MAKKKEEKPFIVGVCDDCEQGGLMINIQGVHWCLDCLKESLGWHQTSTNARDLIVKTYDLLAADPKTAALIEKVKNLSPAMRHSIALGRSMRRLRESAARGEQ